MFKTLATTTLAIALQAMAMTAHAAQQCTEFTRFEGGPVILACKNVPDNPAPSTSQPTKPEPAQTKPAKPAEPVAPAATATAPTPEPATAAQFNTLSQQAFEGIAQAAALAPLFPSSVGKTTVNIGAATYQGQTAIGLALAHRPTQSLVFSAGVSAGSSRNNLVQISAGFQF